MSTFQNPSLFPINEIDHVEQNNYLNSLDFLRELENNYHYFLKLSENKKENSSSGHGNNKLLINQHRVKEEEEEEEIVNEEKEEEKKERKEEEARLNTSHNITPWSENNLRHRRQGSKTTTTKTTLTAFDDEDPESSFNQYNTMFLENIHSFIHAHTPINSTTSNTNTNTTTSLPITASAMNVSVVPSSSSINTTTPSSYINSSNSLGQLQDQNRYSINCTNETNHFKNITNLNSNNQAVYNNNHRNSQNKFPTKILSNNHVNTINHQDKTRIHPSVKSSTATTTMTTTTTTTTATSKINNTIFHYFNGNPSSGSNNGTKKNHTSTTPKRSVSTTNNISSTTTQNSITIPVTSFHKNSTTTPSYLIPHSLKNKLKVNTLSLQSLPPPKETYLPSQQPQVTPRTSSSSSSQHHHHHHRTLTPPSHDSNFTDETYSQISLAKSGNHDKTFTTNMNMNMAMNPNEINDFLQELVLRQNQNQKLKQQQQQHHEMILKSQNYFIHGNSHSDYGGGGGGEHLAPSPRINSRNTLLPPCLQTSTINGMIQVQANNNNNNSSSLAPLTSTPLDFIQNNLNRSIPLSKNQTTMYPPQPSVPVLTTNSTSATTTTTSTDDRTLNQLLQRQIKLENDRIKLLALLSKRSNHTLLQQSRQRLSLQPQIPSTLTTLLPDTTTALVSPKDEDDVEVDTLEDSNPNSPTTNNIKGLASLLLTRSKNIQALAPTMNNPFANTSQTTMANSINVPCGLNLEQQASCPGSKSLTTTTITNTTTTTPSSFKSLENKTPWELLETMTEAKNLFSFKDLSESDFLGNSTNSSLSAHHPSSLSNSSTSSEPNSAAMESGLNALKTLAEPIYDETLEIYPCPSSTILSSFQFMEEGLKTEEEEKEEEAVSTTTTTTTTTSFVHPQGALTQTMEPVVKSCENLEVSSNPTNIHTFTKSELTTPLDVEITTTSTTVPSSLAATKSTNTTGSTLPSSTTEPKTDSLNSMTNTTMGLGPESSLVDSLESVVELTSEPFMDTLETMELTSEPVMDSYENMELSSSEPVMDVYDTMELASEPIVVDAYETMDLSLKPVTAMESIELMESMDHIYPSLVISNNTTTTTTMTSTNECKAYFSHEDLSASEYKNCFTNPIPLSEYKAPQFSSPNHLSSFPYKGHLSNSNEMMNFMPNSSPPTSPYQDNIYNYNSFSSMGGHGPTLGKYPYKIRNFPLSPELSPVIEPKKLDSNYDLGDSIFSTNSLKNNSFNIFSSSNNLQDLFGPSKSESLAEKKKEKDKKNQSVTTTTTTTTNTTHLKENKNTNSRNSNSNAITKVKDSGNEGVVLYKKKESKDLKNLQKNTITTTTTTINGKNSNKENINDNKDLANVKSVAEKTCSKVEEKIEKKFKNLPETTKNKSNGNEYQNEEVKDKNIKINSKTIKLEEKDLLHVPLTTSSNKIRRVKRKNAIKKLSDTVSLLHKIDEKTNGLDLSKMVKKRPRGRPRRIQPVVEKNIVETKIKMDDKIKNSDISSANGTTKGQSNKFMEKETSANSSVTSSDNEKTSTTIVEKDTNGTIESSKNFTLPTLIITPSSNDNGSSQPMELSSVDIPINSNKQTSIKTLSKPIETKEDLPKTPIITTTTTTTTPTPMDIDTAIKEIKSNVLVSTDKDNNESKTSPISLAKGSKVHSLIKEKSEEVENGLKESLKVEKENSQVVSYDNKSLELSPKIKVLKANENEEDAKKDMVLAIDRENKDLKQNLNEKLDSMDIEEKESVKGKEISSSLEIKNEKVKDLVENLENIKETDKLNANSVISNDSVKKENNDGEKEKEDAKTLKINEDKTDDKEQTGSKESNIEKLTTKEVEIEKSNSGDATSVKVDECENSSAKHLPSKQSIHTMIPSIKLKFNNKTVHLNSSSAANENDQKNTKNNIKIVLNLSPQKPLPHATTEVITKVTPLENTPHCEKVNTTATEKVNTNVSSIISKETEQQASKIEEDQKLIKMDVDNSSSTTTSNVEEDINEKIQVGIKEEENETENQKEKYNTQLITTKNSQNQDCQNEETDESIDNSIERLNSMVVDSSFEKVNESTLSSFVENSKKIISEENSCSTTANLSNDKKETSKPLVTDSSSKNEKSQPIQTTTTTTENPKNLNESLNEKSLVLSPKERTENEQNYTLFKNSSSENLEKDSNILENSNTSGNNNNSPDVKFELNTANLLNSVQTSNDNIFENFERSNSFSSSSSSSLTSISSLSSNDTLVEVVEEKEEKDITQEEKDLSYSSIHNLRSRKHPLNEKENEKSLADNNSNGTKTRGKRRKLTKKRENFDIQDYVESNENDVNSSTVQHNSSNSQHKEDNGDNNFNGVKKMKKRGRKRLNKVKEIKKRDEPVLDQIQNLEQKIKNENEPKVIIKMEEQEEKQETVSDEINQEEELVLDIHQNTEPTQQLKQPQITIGRPLGSNYVAGINSVNALKKNGLVLVGRKRIVTKNVNRPYVCSTCGAGFVRKHDLNRHEKVHTGIKNYKCPYCSRAFSRNDALTRHLRVEYKHKNQNKVLKTKKKSLIKPKTTN